MHWHINVKKKKNNKIKISLFFSVSHNWKTGYWLMCEELVILIPVVAVIQIQQHYKTCNNVNATTLATHSYEMRMKSKKKKKKTTEE